MRIGALILAAGNGTRFGNEKKQFIIFDGKPLYKHVYDKVSTIFNLEDIVIVGVDIKGGDTRSKSVFEGLKKLANNKLDRVVIFEAARPLVTIEQINEIAFCDYPSVTFVMPLVNTIIYRNGTYINRNEMYEMLVPQSFNFDLLYKAYCSGKYLDYTDETRIMFEEYGIKPKFIETKQNLYKVTYKRDIAVLQSINELIKEKKL